MNNKYKFLAFDVDNTITKSCEEIENDMAYVLNNLREELIFTSGTNAQEIKRMISSKLRRSHHILGNMGTQYWIVKNDLIKKVYEENIETKEKEKIISSLRKISQKYNLIPLTSEEDQIQDRGSQITFSILGRNAPKEKKEKYDPTKEKRQRLREELLITLKEYEITIGGTTRY